MNSSLEANLIEMTMNNYFYNDIIKGKNKIAYNNPEQNFMKNLHTLKDLLIEDNYTNIKNLSQSNYNNNEIFSYLKAIIRKFILKTDKLTQRIKVLQTELAKVDPKNPSLYKSHEEQFNSGEAGMKLHNFVPLKSRIADNFNKKFVQPTVFEQRSNPLITYGGVNDNRQNIRKQAKQIERFISGQLIKSLVQDKQKKYPIVKDMIVKLYLRWSQLNKRTPVIKNTPQIKSMITNELKKNFPNIDHNDKHYRGIIFRYDLIESTRVKIQELSAKSVKAFTPKTNRQLPIDNQSMSNSSQYNNNYSKHPYMLEDDDYEQSYIPTPVDNGPREIQNNTQKHIINDNQEGQQKLLNDSDYYEMLQFENTAIYPF